MLYRSEIEDIKNNGYFSDGIITDMLVENFYNLILKEDEKEFFNFIFSKNPTQADLDNLLKIWDIEVKGGVKSLALAYAMKMYPELEFSQYEQPRLKGLLNYYRFQNLDKIANFTKIIKELNKINITPLVLNNGAMKFLRQDLPRVMDGIDIVLNKKDYKKALSLIFDMGYVPLKISDKLIEFYKPNSKEKVLNMYNIITFDAKNEAKFLKQIFKRAKKELVFGVQCFLPINEDLFFMTLMNIAILVRRKVNQFEVLFDVFDSKFLLDSKNDFNWKIVKKNAKLTSTCVQANMALKFLKKISNNTFKDIFCENEASKYSTMVIFEYFYLEDIRNKSRALKISKVIFNPKKWIEYLFVKSKYMFLKNLKTHPFLIKLFVKI